MNFIFNFAAGINFIRMAMEENKIIIYQSEDGLTQIDVRMENDMIWLTRQQIATLFDRDYKIISKHINNALKEELADSVVVAKYAKPLLMELWRAKCKRTRLTISISK